MGYGIMNLINALIFVRINALLLQSNHMNKLHYFLLILIFIACKEEKAKALTAQEIIDKSITISGGQLFEKSTVSFDFRKRNYISEMVDGKEVLTRIMKTDTAVIKDVRTGNGLIRYIDGSTITLADTTANKYANSVNSVHYFSKLPYGLNDPAVQKEHIGEIKIKGKDYYKIKVTFNEVGGGDDFDDTYIYWINKETFKPDFLGYSFHVDGGGTRFRVAYNERYVNKIRFVDYENLKPKNGKSSIYEADSLYIKDGLELLSKIELENISVNQGNYN